MPRDPEHSAHPDGIGNNCLMAGTSHGVSLGTAALLMMGLTQRVGTTRPAATAHLGNGAPETFRLQATSKPTTHGYVDHVIEIPMTADISCERQLDAQTLTDEMAREHGFASMKAWRKELGIKKDAPATIFSYPVTLTPGAELPHDPDKNGSRLNSIMDAAYDAWKSGSDRSIKRARKYFETQPEDVQTEAFQRIAPYKALSDEDRTLWLSKAGKKLHANGATPEELQAYQLPSDVRAQRIFEPGLTPEPAVEKGPRPKRGRQRLEDGDGWSVHQHDEKPREGATPSGGTPDPEEAPPKTHVARLGKRDPKGNAHRKATRRETRIRADLDYDNVADEVMYTTSLDASVIARAANSSETRAAADARRARYKGKPHSRIQGNEDDSLNSSRER